MQTSVSTPKAGCILYDGACGACSRAVLFLHRVLVRHGFDVAPLQASWVRERLGLKDGEVLEDIRLLRPDGSQLRGPDVYRFVFRCVWWLWPIYFLSNFPLLHYAFDAAYRAFARNRYRFSRSCALRPPDRESQP